MSDYHFVSDKDLGEYVRSMSKLYHSKEAFLEEVNLIIEQLNESADNYANEVKFYERVRNNILTLLEKKKLGKTKKE